MTLVFEEHAPYEQGFAAHYATHVAPEIETIEKLRQKFLNYFWLTLGAGVCLGLIAIPFLNSSPHKPFGMLLFWAVIIGIALITIFICFKKKAKRALSPHIVSFYENTSIDPDKYIPAGDLKKFNILPWFNKYYGEDLCVKTGVYRFCEITLVEVNQLEKNEEEKRSFSGLALLITLPYVVHAPTRLCIDKGKVGNWLSKLASPTGDTVGLEDPVFEKIFEVFSTDQIEARRILTPAFMEKLLSLNALMVHWKQNGENVEKFLQIAELKAHPENINNNMVKIRTL